MQPPTNIRKILQNALIADLSALVKENTIPPTPAVPVFPTVSKYFYQIPTATPALYLANGLTDRQTNLNFDELRVSFTAYIYEVLEANGSANALAAKIDRLTECEAYLYKYLAHIPNNIGEVNGVTVYDSSFVRATYNETDSPQGRAMELAVEFDLFVNVNVQLINTNS